MEDCARIETGNYAEQQGSNPGYQYATISVFNAGRNKFTDSSRYRNDHERSTEGTEHTEPDLLNRASAHFANENPPTPPTEVF